MFGSRDDRAKVHDKANQLALKGNVAKAIALLKEHAGANPDDDRTLLKLADLYRRDGDDAAAVECFTRAANLYVGRGFTLKAAASLRQAVALAPADLDLLEQLAGINADLGLGRDAARDLERVAAAAAQAGDRARLVALRRRILGLLPGDAGATVRLADLLSEERRHDEAIALLEEAAAPLDPQSQPDLWILFQERLCALQPNEPARAKALARVLLARASPKRALAQLKPCFSADPADVEALTLLAQAFGAIGQASKAGLAWREIARVHQRAGRAPEEKAAWEKVLALLPGDVEAKTALAPPPAPPSPVELASLARELAEADFLAEHGGEEEARAILLGLRELHPGAAEIARRLEALSAVEITAEDLVAEEELVTEEEPRDSTTMILDRVPADRLPRVAEAALHRDLAVAFMEMNLFTEALGELEKAIAADPLREADTLALAGRCHLARGAPRDAISAYRRALASAMLSFEAAAAVHFELGEALETVGEQKEALAQFREANRLEPGFRNVGKRIKALGG